MSDPVPERVPDVRVGSATNALAPVSVAQRKTSAGPWQWLGLSAVVAAYSKSVS